MKLPDGYPLTELFREKRQKNQDFSVIVSDSNNRRGTGKTTLSLQLARELDQTDEGLTPEKVALSPQEVQKAYVELPKGSALVLDEAEAGLSKYEASSRSNKAMREVVSMGRIEEKYLILNLPASSELDRDLKKLCDFWLLVKRRGLVQGHLLNWNNYKEQPRTPKAGEYTWSPIDATEDDELLEVYTYLTKEKQAHLRGERDESDQLVSPGEVSEQVEAARSEAETQKRNELAKRFYENTELTQKEIADTIGLSRSRVADILTE